MDIFDTAHMVSSLENPLTAPAAGQLFTMKLERHARVKERGAAAAARGTRGGRRRVAPFNAEGYGASTELGASAAERTETEESEEEDASDGGVEYDDAGEISVDVHLDEIRGYVTKGNRRHKDPVGQPQEWFDIVVSNRTMKRWTADDPKAPPKGWVQDGWDGQTPESVKGEYTLILVLKGAINELLTNKEMPETQTEGESLRAPQWHQAKQASG